MIVDDLMWVTRPEPQEERPRNGPKKTGGWEPSARTVSGIQRRSPRVPLGQGVDPLVPAS